MVSDALIAIVNEEPFQQLTRIRQLGPAHLVYPGATHTRFSHSLGVFHIARRMIRALASHDAFDVDVEGVKAFLCAALVHDLGHYPYTHSMKELPLKDHEQLTGEIVSREPIRHRIENTVGVDAARVAAIVDTSIDAGSDAEVEFFRRVLSGPLDPDKLDYLSRDAYFCGVPYGVQDIDFAISRIVPDAESGVSLGPDGVTALESVLFSKYLMYRAVYWHHTVRVATAMIKRAVHLALRNGVWKPDDLYGLDDDSFVRLAERTEFAPFRLIKNVTRRKLFKIVHEEVFDSSIEAHTRLADMVYREKTEADLSRVLSRVVGRSVEPESVVIDVPEDVSFEIPIEFRDRSVGTVFDADVVTGFTRTLRRVRIIVDPEYANARFDWCSVFSRDGTQPGNPRYTIDPTREIM